MTKQEPSMTAHNTNYVILIFDNGHNIIYDRNRYNSINSDTIDIEPFTNPTDAARAFMHLCQNFINPLIVPWPLPLEVIKEIEQKLPKEKLNRLLKHSKSSAVLESIKDNPNTDAEEISITLKMSLSEAVKITEQLLKQGKIRFAD